MRSPEEKARAQEDVNAIEQLENDEKYHLVNFKTLSHLPDNRHGNTYLTLAIAWNKLIAATYLIKFFRSHIINTPDTFPGSQSTPLILAAKTNATEIALLLIDKGAKLNEQDYRGFTALHYAAMMRNNALTEALLNAGADNGIRNQFDKFPSDYYWEELTANKLAYPYKTNPDSTRMRNVCDYGEEHYTGTNLPDYSAIRWFICQILINQSWGSEEVAPLKQTTHLFICANKIKTFDNETLPETLLAWAKLHLALRTSVQDSRFYNAAIDCFCKNRNALFKKETAEILEPNNQWHEMPNIIENYRQN